MGKFSKDELLAAFDHYETTVATCSETGDWRPFADLFTEDVVYLEHAYGEFHGREEVREWIVATMAPYPHMRFPHTWLVVDEEEGAIVTEILNTLDHPTEPGVTFALPNITRLVYAGDNLFSCEEDIYNPHRDGARAIGGWIKAGGEMLCMPPDMKYV